MLRIAKENSDYLICGILTDDVANRVRGVTITNFKERWEVIKEIKCVDELMPQDSKDPTKNLKAIRKKHPSDKIYLFHGDNWKEIPGAEYVKSIGGEVVTPTYYKRLSLEKTHFSIEYNKKKSKSLIETKARTLTNLKHKLKKSKIEDLVKFQVANWKRNPEQILKNINRKLGFGKIVVRSSTMSEDSYEESKAGFFNSVLDVSANSKREMIDAINKVVSSYDKNLKNEVLIQKQTKGILVSGVIFTRELETDSPYYIINYDDSGSTDSITSGKEDKKIKISRNIKIHDGCQKKWYKLIDAIREIESLIPDIPLDIEFAITKEDVVIFQVRPLAANKITTGLDNEVFHELDELKIEKNNTYSDMSFWNPSEIIGTLPNRLDYSLYEYIITDNHWDTALASMGYHDVRPAKLMVIFGGKPYIDLKYTFNALLPDKLSENIRNKLVKSYFDKLFKNPELHDKVEFEIIHNCYNYTFDDTLNELTNKFTDTELKIIKDTVKQLTDKIFRDSEKWFSKAKDGICQLNESRRNTLKSIDHKSTDSIITGIKNLLDSTINYGTINFSRLARMAFIGNSILKSMVVKKMISKEFYDDYLKSISVVRMGKHLRPGTYNIMSPRYDQNPEIKIICNEKKKTKILKIPDDLKDKDNFIRKSIEGRELVKFEFTKNLSDAIELIAELGEQLDFSREDMACLDINEIFMAKSRSAKHIKEIWRLIINHRKKEKTVHEKLSLPPLVFSDVDFKVVPTYVSKPNFITQKQIKGELVVLDMNEKQDLNGKIVVIENADPGYDWIFGRKIKGLITCYGGVASHMSIRCAEFGIPAAIGCGVELYKYIKNGVNAELDGKNAKIIIDGIKIT